MGLSEVQKIAVQQQAQAADDKSKAKKKLTEEQKAAQELPGALAKKSEKAEQKVKLAELPQVKKEGFDNGEKLMLGAVALGAVATVASFLKPSLGKMLKAGAKLANPGAKAVEGGLKGKHALMTVGTLAGASIATGCSKDLLEEEHNHFVPLPTDTITKDNYIEKIIERPVYITKTDTLYKTDTISVPEYITKTDTIYKTDTIKVPEYITKTDTIYKTDTIKVPEYINKTDTVWKTDTIKVPEYITKTDTVYKTDTIKVPEYITKTDTVYQTKTDTVYETKTDTIQLPGETIYINEEFESDVPEKIKEMFNDLGIDTTGVGKFVYGIDFQDMKNNKIHSTMWDGGRTSRDGDIYRMNEVKTGWDHEAEAYVFGKNESFATHDVYNNSNGNLSDMSYSPLKPIDVKNNNNKPNWFVFNPGQQTAEPGNWEPQAVRTFTKISDGKWQSSDGFTYEKGDKPNSIKKTNQYGSEWLLENVSIYGSNVAKDPKKK